ncbi:MAG: hypothetical protein BGO95_07700 [Micrococcales bacterium 73-13]|nr:MAG: hypothetical protein BGO95_07700 [Micrococcales bacterium 73-13]
MAEESQTSPDETAKAKMLAALERKKQGTGAGPGAAAAKGGAGAAHGKAGGRREFRRKSS